MTSTKTRAETAPQTEPEAVTDLPAADPFAIQLEGATLTSKQAKASTLPDWEGPIPASVAALVARAVGENARVVMPCTDGAVAYALRRAIITQVKRAHPGMAAHVRERMTEDGDLTAVLFTVGTRSGRKVAGS